MPRAILVLALFAVGCGLPTQTVLTGASPGAPDAGVAYAVPDAIGDDDAPPPPGSISFDSDQYTITGPAGFEASVPFTLTGLPSVTHVTTLTWFVADSSFRTTNPICAADDSPCDITDEMLPITGTIFCVPVMGMPRTAQLTAFSNTPAADFANVRCEVPSDAPSFQAPGTVSLNAQVNGSTPGQFMISNNGNIDVTITLFPGTENPARWTIMDCVSPATCVVPQAGPPLVIDLAFNANTHGDLDSSVTVQSTSHPMLAEQTVILDGTGLGGVVDVTNPPGTAFSLDFGTLGRDQERKLDIAITNSGNQTIRIDPQIQAPAAPFSVTTTPPVDIFGGLNGTIEVQCLSASAMTEQVRTITLAPGAGIPAAYASNTGEVPATIEVRCAIANTAVQINGPFLFGELRVGEQNNTLDVLITNPVGNAPVTIDNVTIESVPSAVTMSTPVLGPLPAGMQRLTTTLTLDTMDVVDAFSTGELVVLVTENSSQETLRVPISGKVGAPSAIVIPDALDFGSICVGTTVEGMVTMSNNGSSTLRVRAPNMSTGDFVPQFTSPTTYPDVGAILMPGADAVVGVIPMTGAAPGMYASNMTWQVDVPQEFDIPISLELVDEGTAVSPARLSFTPASIVDPPLVEQIITLENCGPDTTFVSYAGVGVIAGNAGAWRLMPSQQRRELMAREKMRVNVGFQPRVPGLYEANLDFEVDDEKTTVVLIGEGTGVIPEQTSFYACGCSGAHGGWSSVAIPLAGVLVLLRRRRRSTRPSA